MAPGASRKAGKVAVGAPIFRAFCERVECENAGHFQISVSGHLRGKADSPQQESPAITPMPLNIADLRSGAEAGSCVDQCVLGLCYLYGTDVEINYEEALRLLTAAAEQGASRAMLNLGYMFAQGLGMEKNVAEAVRWFEAAALRDSDGFLARIELARIFALGDGIPRDLKAAFDLYSAAITIAPSDGFADQLEEARRFVRESLGR